MPKDFSTMEDSNRSSNPTIHEISDPARRVILKGSAAMAVLGGLVPVVGAAGVAGCAVAAGTGSNLGSGEAALGRAKPTLIGFKGVPMSAVDAVIVPDGYVAQAIAPWGEAVGVAGNMPAFKPDGSNTAAEQAMQMGMHHDGLAFYALGATSAEGSRRGLLVMNHEYTDDGLLHTDGMKTWSAEKVAKAQAAHGVSVIEVQLNAANEWQMVRPSRFAKRHTAATPFAVQGPAAGHAMMKTAADPSGTRVLGTLNNCASSRTPWGTYLSGEENFAFYFNAGDNMSAHHQRYGLRKAGFYRWPEGDERFDATKHPNEPNRFGWVVEIDPMDPLATPIKRTALGRAAHEGAWVAVTKDGRAVVYSGEDARFEYIYKFVSRDRIQPASAGLSQAQANRTLLDHGTLYVARFDADGKGAWLPLVAGRGPLTAAQGFADQGDVVIKSRQASDALGGTKMDRPEWLAIDPNTQEIYCTLTNNTGRGTTPNQPGVDPANPRANNTMGHIIRWKESGDFDAATFTWNHLVLAGDPANARADAKGNIVGDIYACPDGIAFDARGVLWIETDMHATQMGKGDFANLSNNQMLACDPLTKETRRFLTAPVNCEVTGIDFTPDMRSMFINIQHPGETPSDRSDPDAPDRYSTWPTGQKGARPRSATVWIRRKDGGVIGT